MRTNHFVSYPKSGRSWIRYILVLLGLDSTVFFHHDGFEFNDGKRPPHEFSIVDRIYRYAQVERLIYLERDPRDVMVSLFYQITGRFRDIFGYNGSLSDFIRDDYFGAQNLKRFRQIWAKIAAEPKVLNISYEECHLNTAETMRRILDHYCFEVSDRKLVEAVDNARFDNMRHLENAGTFAEPWLRRRNGEPKVRKGIVGDHRNELDNRDIAYLNRVFGFSCDEPQMSKSRDVVSPIQPQSKNSFR